MPSYQTIKKLYSLFSNTSLARLTHVRVSSIMSELAISGNSSERLCPVGLRQKLRAVHR